MLKAQHHSAASKQRLLQCIHTIGYFAGHRLPMHDIIKLSSSPLPFLRCDSFETVHGYNSDTMEGYSEHIPVYVNDSIWNLYLYCSPLYFQLYPSCLMKKPQVSESSAAFCLFNLYQQPNANTGRNIFNILNVKCCGLKIK